MKQVSLMRSIKFSLVGIATLFTMNSFAQSSSAKFELSPGNATVQQVSTASSVTARIYPSNVATRFILVTENPYGEKISIRLTGSSGRVYEKVTRKKNLRTVFDLSQVEDDTYEVTVSSPGKHISKELVLSTTYAAATKRVEIQ